MAPELLAIAGYGDDIGKSNSDFPDRRITNDSTQKFRIESGTISVKDIPTGAYETVFNDSRTLTVDEQAFVLLRR